MVISYPYSTNDNLGVPKSIIKIKRHFTCKCDKIMYRNA